jgi:hypothetical protein
MRDNAVRAKRPVALRWWRLRTTRVSGFSCLTRPRADAATAAFPLCGLPVESDCKLDPRCDVVRGEGDIGPADGAGADLHPSLESRRRSEARPGIGGGRPGSWLVSQASGLVGEWVGVRGGCAMFVRSVSGAARLGLGGSSAV